MAATKLKERKPRCTAYQKKFRLDVIEECMINQMSNSEILRYITRQPIMTPERKKKIDSIQSDGQDVPKEQRRTAAEKKAAYISTIEKWDISLSQVQKDTKCVMKEWDKAILPEKKKMRMQLWYTLRKTMSEARLFKDGRTVVAAIDRACKMFGLDEKTEIDLVAKVAQVSMADLQKSIDDIKEEAKNEEL